MAICIFGNAAQGEVAASASICTCSDVDHFCICTHRGPAEVLAPSTNATARAKFDVKSVSNVHPADFLIEHNSVKYQYFSKHFLTVLFLRQNTVK